MSIDAAWERICSHAGEEFLTITGLPFTYAVRGSYLYVIRDGREVNRSLSRSNFATALELLPSDGPGALQRLQGPTYTWAILMDSRVSRGE